MGIYEERINRMEKAVKMEPVDKIPFSFNGPAYLAKAQGLSMYEATTQFDKATDAAVAFSLDHPGIDSIHTPIISPYVLTPQWLSAVKCPGIDLPDDELWQIDEKEVIHREDYRKILDVGYENWLMELLTTNLGNPFSKLGSFMQNFPVSEARLKEEASLPVVNSGGSFCSPFEGFCGGRTLMEFYVDLVEEPELVRAALDKAMEYTLNSARAQLKDSPAWGAWVGVWRGAPQYISHDIWEEFVWKDTLKLINCCIDNGLTPILHFDSSWDKELESLKELPEKKCILMLDGTTDMRKARKVLGDRVCLMGDVPSRMTAYSSPEEVYKYVIDLINDVGPETGLIVSTGCDAPLNAKKENMDAIIQATVDYKI